ncbi:hypothetical protein JXD20_03360 [Candidatus Peregrinibacteria bacterium]|nr:hypothetical protein [Candidatus Peregrinibacteria bacterium]
MPDQTTFISQIQQEEASAAKMLKEVEEENERRFQEASDEAELIIRKAEEEERDKATVVIRQAKEEAKAEYGRILTDANNARRDIIEAGKTKIPTGKAKVMEAFMAMFE